MMGCGKTDNDLEFNVDSTIENSIKEENPQVKSQFGNINCTSTTLNNSVRKTRYNHDTKKTEFYWANDTFTYCFYQDASNVNPSSGVNSLAWNSNSKVHSNVSGSTISSISQFLGSLDINAGATITICIDQPSPNSDMMFRNLYNNVKDIGEAFVEISQGMHTKVFGFYPSTEVKPVINLEASGVFKDKSSTSYDVGLTFGVTGSQLSEIIDRVEKIESLGVNYNFLTNNNINLINDVAYLSGYAVYNPEVLWNGDNNTIIGYAQSAGIMGQYLRNTSINSTIFTEFGYSGTSTN
ncbi:hypothetical protein JL193_15365 [Polaribacter batillariae]|uniref:Uncharacterized protein n=1 Tax=Polaribacter batillariae TaxID=2808900 RepID=A0ABX7ST77_9FLAO|nr:hypothetical protein [Polaribacter batillariae]QTD37447.1 hypothetical protein JL193_15365 [Polaribacter batillariae]